MSRRNRSRYRNHIGLPVILFLVVTAGLIGGRWVKEVRAHNLQNRLSVELRQLNHECVELRRDIGDLEGRETSLLTEDSLHKSLAKLGITLEAQRGVPLMEIEINPEDTLLPVAQTQIVAP